MDTLWPVYHRDIPPFLSQLAAAAPMQRLRQVGMNCGCEYTSFPRFRRLPSYSRYDHSLGVGLIVWHFTGDAAQAAAGLLHDVATPVFAHTVDFLQGDHLHQEATEGPTAALISASGEIRAVLNAHGIAVEDVWDYHRYPLADNDPPGLSADRLEYTLGNLVNYGFASSAQAAALYADLTVVENEQSAPELAFSTPERAAEFALASLKTSRVYVADEDRFSMELLSRLLRLADDRAGGHRPAGVGPCMRPHVGGVSRLLPGAQRAGPAGTGTVAPGARQAAVHRSPLPRAGTGIRLASRICPGA